MNIKKDKKYRILEVCIDLDGGGSDRYLYNNCTRIKDIQFDFAPVINKNGILEPKLIEAGCEITHVPRLSNGILKNMLALRVILKKHKYDAIHVHIGYQGVFALITAWLCGVKTRIVHSHFANIPESTKTKILRKLHTPFAKLFATHLAACGVDAAKWMWGEKAYKKGKVKILNNAIPTDEYAFSADIRVSLRNELNIKDSTLVIGHVGRLCDQKNQKRLISIFKATHDCVPDSVLVLVGFDSKDYDVRSLIKEYNLENVVKILGVRSDANRLLNAFDGFAFPSLYEGLPFVLIETQCNGLPCVVSDKVTPMAKVTNSVKFLSLDESNETWAKAILESKKKGRNLSAVEEVTRAGYDLVTEAQNLRDYYIKSIKQ